MTRSTLTIIVGLAFAPLTASAQVRDANSLLRGQVQALRAAGFSGMTEVQMPQAPVTARVLPVSVQANETTEALAALIREARISVNLYAQTTQALGFSVNPLPAKGFTTPKDQTVVRHFTITSSRGKTEIIISAGSKETRELRSCLISVDGTLEAAAVTRKVNGEVLAEKVPVSEAQAGCRELLEFWTRYYREKLKNPDIGT